MSKYVTSVEVVEPGSGPDVDSDVNTELIAPATEHIAEVYGRDTIANIVTLIQFGMKSAFQQMCTIYEIPSSQANYATKLIPKPIEGVECSYDEVFNEDSERYDEGQDFRVATSGDKWSNILEGMQHIEKKAAYTGVHACGIIMSSRTLSEVIPLKVRNSDGRTLTQWTYPECESLGLVKMDLLGVDTVDIIQNTVSYIMRSGKTPPNMVDVMHGPLDDANTFALLQKGNTTGVFQLGSPGVQDLLRKMKPTTIDDIAATTALYRPGPMGMQSHTRYADRKTGREDIDFIHDDFRGSPLEDILRPTQGLCIMQEQVMHIANQIADMSLQEADDLRKAMGKKKKDVMAKMHDKFVQGALNNGYSHEAVNKLWDTIAEFARYGFNKSHTYSYAIMSYQTAYLKANYPVEYMAAQLASRTDNKDDVLVLLKEARRMGLRVSNVDVNASDVQVAPNVGSGDGDIVYGLAGVDGVSESVARTIVDERNANGPFTSVKDFVHRCYQAGISVRTVYTNIALAGGFDSLEVTRKGVVDAESAMMKDSKVKHTRGASLFDQFGEDTAAIDIASDEYPFALKLRYEADVVGLYLSDHPMSRMGMPLSHVQQTTIAQLTHNHRSVKRTRIAGSITNLETKRTFRGQRSMRVTIDDGTGYLTGFVENDIVQGMTKWDYQQTVKQLYLNGEGAPKDEVVTAIHDTQTIAQPTLRKNNVYTFELSFTPGDEESMAKAKITSVMPVYLAHDGTLPIRIRAHENESAETNNTILTKLPKKLSNTWEGKYPIYVAHDTTPDPSIFEPDQVFRDAEHVMREEGNIKQASRSTQGVDETTTQKTLYGDTQQRRGTKKTKTGKSTHARSWPPPRTQPEEHYVDNRTLPERVESCCYHDSGYRTDKTKNVELAIEKFVGVENYDLGAVDPVVGE